MLHDTDAAYLEFNSCSACADPCGRSLQIFNSLNTVQTCKIPFQTSLESLHDQLRDPDAH